jgi:pyridoxal phosphate enzyme (YggS family)
MDIVRHIESFKKTLPEKVKLIAVSKTQSNQKILEIYNTGHKIFGENKVQELVSKYEQLPKDIEWHMIGHLQTNKVKFIAPFVHLIHSVDSLNLLDVINKEAGKCNRSIDCLLQVKIAKEETKFGIGTEEVSSLLNSDLYQHMKHIRIIGLMAMATFTDDQAIIRNEFRKCKTIFNELKTTFFNNQPQFNEISMGMSDDYSIALEEGSTMIRIGSLLFGQRK